MSVVTIRIVLTVMRKTRFIKAIRSRKRRDERGRRTIMFSSSIQSKIGNLQH